MFVDKKKERKFEIPLGPMADISFLLLIFFLVSTTMNTDKGIMMQLPPWGEQKPVPPKNISKVLVNERGEILMDGELMSLSTLKQKVREKTMANPNLIISLKTDNRTSYDRYVEVLDQVKAGGAKKISIAEPEQ